MGGTRRHKWFSFHHQRSASVSDPPHDHRQAPPEFLCPISGLLMSDPVVVPSGQTFERICVQVCRNLGFVPILEDKTRPDFSTVIPNLTMKSTILSWCKRAGSDHPRPPEYAYVEGVVRARMEYGTGTLDPVRSPSVTNDIQPVQSRFGNLNLSSSSVESVTVDSDPVAAPNNRTGRDSSSSFSWSGTSSSSSGMTSGTDNSTQNPNSFSASNISSYKPVSPEEEEVFEKLRSQDRLDHEQGLILLRKMTRSDEKARVSLCTDGILSFLRSMIVSRYGQVQTNAAASLVNLSLEKRNKVKIVRSGFIPLLIDVLKSGTAEAQEHAAGAIFSIAVEDENKMVIGVLGALQPLLHALRAAESDRTRQDAALALYHLTLIPSNQTKLIRCGAVPILLSMIQLAEDASLSSLCSRVLLILCNLAACSEGKAEMLEGNAVAILVRKLRDGGAWDQSDMEQENCVTALLSLSVGNLRFKGLAKEAGAEEVLKEVEERGNDRMKEKAAKILQIMSGGAAIGGAGGEAREWEQMLAASGLSRVAYSSNF